MKKPQPRISMDFYLKGGRVCDIASFFLYAHTFCAHGRKPQSPDGILRIRYKIIRFHGARIHRGGIGAHSDHFRLGQLDGLLLGKRIFIRNTLR